MTDAPRLWAEAPAHAPRRGLGQVDAFVLALVIALIGPLARAASLPASEPLQVAVVGTIAVLLGAFVPARGWVLRILIAGGAAAVLLPVQGETIPLWLAAGLLLATWVARDLPPVPWLPPPGPGVQVPVAFLCGVAAWVGSDPAHSWQQAIPFGAALALPLVSRLGAGAVDRAARWCGARVGSLVTWVVFGLLGAVAVLVPWLAQRTLRIDPLRSVTGWRERERRPLQPSAPWAGDPVPPVRRLGPAGRAAVLATVAALAIGAVWYRSPGRRDRQAPPSNEILAQAQASERTAAAVRGADWYAAYQEDIAWVLDEKVAMRPYEVYRLLDVETRTVNIHGGDRDSWKAPACGCKRLTVWLYGGGGAFGFDQRDEHTIASELAKVAAQHGVTLDVVNRGLPGQLHWRTALRFEWDLIHEPAPDLAVFYEGAEEVEGAEVLDAKGLGDAKGPYEPFADQLYDQIEQVPKTPDPPPGVSLPPTTVPDLDPSGVGRLAVTRYLRSLQLSDDTSQGFGVPVRYFWQPTRYTRPAAERTSATTASDDRRRTEEFAAAAAALPARVGDLSDAFHGVDRPLFIDGVRHNERGARLVAEELFARLEPQLRRLRRTQGGGG